MKKHSITGGALLLLNLTGILRADAPPAANAAFNSYSNAVALRLDEQHRSLTAFLAPAGTPGCPGDLNIERLTPATRPEYAGALLHHWRGTAFAPGVQAADFERLLRNFNAYPQYFSPQVVAARLLVHEGDHLQAWLRVRQKHVITVMLDTTYDVTFGQLDPHHRYSTSQSNRIAEVDSAPGEEHGFLWRLNTFWSWEERDGGLCLQIEAISLTRSIPRGLEWAIGRYVESIPRESLEFTLRAGRDALERTKQ
ncbi:MAG: hypothetical protein ABJC09_12495 [Terriglobia bacterium]